MHDEHLIKVKMEDALDALIDYRGKTPKKSSCGISTLSAKSVKNGFIDYSQCYFISEDEYKKFMVRGFPKKGDILLTTEAPLGLVAKLDRNDVAVAQRLLTLRGKKGLLDNDYLLYYLQSSAGQAALKARESGTTVTGIKQAEFRKIELLLPSIDNQKRIASILSSLDEKIKNDAQINHNLEEQAKAIFKSWFVDFEPFNGKMPKSWLAKTLADVSKIGAGGDKPHCVSEIQTPEFQYPIYSNGLANDGLYGYASSAKIYEESITVSARGTIGFVCLRQEPYVPIVRLITLIPNTCFVSAKYLYLYLKGINISGTGTTQQQLTVPDFQKTSIMVPDNDTMKRFTICADSIFEQIKHNAKEMRTLAQLRDTLLPKLMSGEIDVSEVEV